MLSGQKKKQRQGKSKGKKKQCLNYAFNTSKAKPSEKKTSLSKCSMYECREAQQSIPNFKKHKMPTTNVKKKLKLQKNSLSNFSKTHLANFNSRHFTESIAAKSSIKDKKQSSQYRCKGSPFKEIMEQNANMIKQENGRFSLNNVKQQKDLSLSKLTAANKSTLCQENEEFSLPKERSAIQQMVENSCLKNVVSISDFLFITSKYEKLIDKLIYDEKLERKDGQVGPQRKAFEKQNQELSYLISEETIPDIIAIQPKTIKKPLCPNLSLGNLRKLNIEDYEDEFMSHYNQLSESWKRDLAVQKRF